VILGRGLVGLVARTVNDLYFVVAVRDLAVDPSVLVKGLGLGLGATLLAALAPALEATAAAPVAVLSRAGLEARRHRAAPRAALAGVAVLGLSAGLIAWPGGSLLLGYGGLFGVLAGAALLAPAATVGITGLLRRPARRLGGVLGGLTTGSVSASLSRTGVAIAALMVAVAATVGVGVMIQSFRGTVVRWLETSLVADVYVSAPGLAGSRTDSTLDPGLIARLVATPGVASVGTYRGVRVGSPHGPTQLVALGLHRESFRQFRFLAGDPARIWAAFADHGAAIVSEPYAARHRIGVGARLRLRTDRGERELTVAGVFADYGSDQGVVMLSRRTYEALWDDRGVASLGIVATPGTDVAALAAALRERAGPDQELLVRDTRTLRAASLQIFDRTFAITAVLRLLALVVAGVGVLSALMALQLERARELAVLRAQGLSPGQLWGMVTAQTGLMGLIAGVLAVPVGLTLAAVLIFVINRRAFGWTLEAEIAPAVLLQAVALAVVAGLLAGVVPALRMTRTPPAVGLREE
jgi:putative ABC transport system permease protein